MPTAAPRHVESDIAELEPVLQGQATENVEEEEDMSGTDEEVMPELPEEDAEDYKSGSQLRNAGTFIGTAVVKADNTI